MAKQRWFKGNIHTHTTESDGDADPEAAVRWYRRHGYDFLVLTDHNHLTLLDYAGGKRRFKRPLLVPGEEVSAQILNGTVPVHINGIGITRVVEPIDADGVVPTIQANVDAIIEAGGIASINHPNYQWAFGQAEISRIVGASLLEVYSGVAVANDEGAPGRPSSQETWDGVLTAGRPIFGVAVDDSHNYHDFEPRKANPGRGWVVVSAGELSTEAIVEALASGDFYASTGIALNELDVSARLVRLSIEQERDYVYTTTFSGLGGSVLSEVVGLEAAYEPRGDEGYVRATVAASSGFRAWTQPAFLG